MHFPVRRLALMGLTATACGLLLLTSPCTLAQGGKYSIKVVKSEPPKELKVLIAKLLKPEAVQLFDGSGKRVCEVWLRSSVPTDATPEQVKNGLTYRELKETTVLGAVRFDEDWTDYRKQKVKAGVYTLRLGFQPMDGDHQGSSMFPDFCLLASAAGDTSPETMEPKKLIEMSQKSIETGHPAVFMLFPNNKPADAPQLAAKEKNHWVLNAKENVDVKGQKGAAIGIGLTLVGAAD